MVRHSRLLLLLAVAAAAIVALTVPGTAAARMTPRSADFRVYVVNGMSDRAFAALARRGAVGLMRPGFGPTTSHTSAVAELIRGAEVNSHIGGTPPGKPLIRVEVLSGRTAPDCHMCIVVQLPPRTGKQANDKLYRVALVGRNYHGLFVSPTTHIPGLVSIVDIAPTALGRPATGLAWVATSHPLARLASLGQQIHSNNRLKYAALFVIAGLMLLLALLGLRAAVTAVPAALLVNLGLGAAQVTDEVMLMAAISVGTVLLAFALARICRNDDALLTLFGGVVLLYAATMVSRPEWQAINPFGPTQNSRFWGIGNQVETLLLVPLLAGTVLARRRFGPAGFVVFGFFGLVVMTDNRLGADGGGAIVLGVALAVLGWRLFRLRLSGLIALLGGSALAVLWLVQRGLEQHGPDHLRSAFSGGVGGLLASLASRWPLSYLPALHAWTLALPLLLVLAAFFVVAWRRADVPATRDLLLALGVALVTSLLVNDSAGYELAGGIAAVGAAARFVPTSAPVRIRVRVPAFLRRPRLVVEPVASELPPS
ncbi:MAG: hypothetical protein QOG85_741 [Gaiellaceae bacterium]|nr:hypothetical protein [Gaiellaceae bacterium]